ncbi:gem-associated protein 6 [Eucyclogobius newberryi]|uniref:gem-associated protein 6 n=1 Tax=Eucyclogobius newberryi TaxID=166745 RepID=UPI003B5B1714
MQSEWRRLGPAHWRALTHKRAVVHARNGDELRGFIVTVDPVSASLVLLDLDGSEVQMVLGHAVKQVQILDQNLDSAQKTRLELFRDPDPGQDWSLDLDRTRTRLLDWIRLNRIPVETEGAGIVVAGGVVTVNPPFRVLDCVGQNQVVLDRVQRLIQNQPKDQDQDPDQDKDPDQDQSQNQDQDSAWSEPEPNQN